MLQGLDGDFHKSLRNLSYCDSCIGASVVGGIAREWGMMSLWEQISRGYWCSRPSSDDEPIVKKRSACSSGRCVCGWTPVSVVSPQHASQTDLRQLLTYVLRFSPFCLCIAVNSRCSARFVASASHLPSISRTDYCTVCWDKRRDRLDSARWATRRRRWSDARRRRVRCAAHTPPTTVVRRRTRLLRRRLHPA